MARRVIAAVASAALCSVSVASGSASAQSYRASGFDAPVGATATANLRIPLGGQKHRSKPTYGLTLGYGQMVGGPDLDGRTTTREMRFADLRFDRQGINRAEVATFNLADLENDPRLSMSEDDTKKSPFLWIVVAVAGLVGVCLLAKCFSGDDNNNNSSNNSS